MRTAAIAPFVVQLVIAIGVMSSLSFYERRRTANELADRLLDRSMERLEERIARYFQTPATVNHTLQVALSPDLFDRNDRAALARLFAQQLRFPAFANIETIQLATLTGERSIFGVGRVDGVVTDLINDSEEPIADEPDLDDREGVLPLAIEQVQQTRDGRSYAFVRSRYREDGTPGAEIARKWENDLTSRNWYTEARDLDRAIWSPVYPMSGSQSLGIMRAEPLRDRDGRTVGVIGSGLQLEAIETFLCGATTGVRGKVYLLERDGLKLVGTSDAATVARPAADDAMARRPIADIPLLASAWEAATARAGDSPVESMPEVVQHPISIAGRRYVVRVTSLEASLGLDWLLVALVSEADLLADNNNRIDRTLVFSLMALLAAIGLGTFVGRRLRRPLHRLSQAAAGVAAGQLDPSALERTTPLIRIREIEMLRQAFISMQAQVQSALGQLEARIVVRDEELRQSQQFLDSIVEHLPVAVFVKDVRDNCRIIQLNAEYERITGRSRAELYGKTVAELYLPEQAEIFAAHDRETITQGTLVEYEAEPFTNAGGQTRILRTTKVPLRDESGEIVYLLGIAKDITDRHRTNAELQAQREAALDGILIFDENRQIATCNQRFFELWEIPPAMLDRGTEAMLAAMRERLGSVIK